MLKNKTILITGGAGSLGKSIVRRIFKDFTDIKKVIVYSRDELKHHYMNWDFSQEEFPIEYTIGDVRDLERLTQMCNEVDIIIHTAALKQISTCENNPEECYKTNVVGTQNVIKAAKNSTVSKLLFVSTDKAVDPSSVYGNSKQAGEHSFRVGDLANAIAPGSRKKIIGARKHEKMHEQFFAKVELNRLLENDDYYIITKERISNNEGIDFYGSLVSNLKTILNSKSNSFLGERDFGLIFNESKRLLL